MELGKDNQNEQFFSDQRIKKQQKAIQDKSKIKETPLTSREELIQKLKNKIDTLKANRTTKKDYIPPRKQRQQKNK